MGKRGETGVINNNKVLIIWVSEIGFVLIGQTKEFVAL